MSDIQSLAREAAEQVHGAKNVGEYLTSIDEDEPGVRTHLFACRLRGYPDWTWAVTTFTDESSDTTSISEVNLLPGDGSLIAPKWVPWAERLADYKALQAALEEQARVEAEEAAAAEANGDVAEVDDDTDDSDDDILDVDEEEDGDEDSESASGLGDESEDSEADSDDAGAEKKIFFRYKFIRRHKKRK